MFQNMHVWQLLTQHNKDSRYEIRFTVYLEPIFLFKKYQLLALIHKFGKNSVSKTVFKYLFKNRRNNLRNRKNTRSCPCYIWFSLNWYFMRALCSHNMSTLSTKKWKIHGHFLILVLKTESCIRILIATFWAWINVLVDWLYINKCLF